MKVLLTGATGFIGSEILKQCIAHHYVSHVYILARRPLDAQFAQHKKVTQILHEDFEHYPPALLERLREEGVEACIWALGGKVEQFADLDEARRVGIAFPIQAAEALSKSMAPARDTATTTTTQTTTNNTRRRRAPFRFVFISGWGAEQNQFRKLWIFAESRRIKGAAEKGLFEVAEASELMEDTTSRAATATATATVTSTSETQGEEGGEKKQGPRCFEVIALRPGGVIAGGDSITTLVSEATMPLIAVDRLAMCTIRVALGGSGGKKTLENKECLGDDWTMVNSFSF